jgi:hypothetical protein
VRKAGGVAKNYEKCVGVAIWEVSEELQRARKHKLQRLRQLLDILFQKSKLLETRSLTMYIIRWKLHHGVETHCSPRKFTLKRAEYLVRVANEHFKEAHHWMEAV